MLITEQRHQYNWSFVFLCANIDAIDIGTRIGVPQDTAMAYNSLDPVAMSSTYATAPKNGPTSLRPEMSSSYEDRCEASRGSKTTA
jgi:hypothetical protein